MDHATFTTAFRAALFGGPPPPGAFANDPDEVERRFAVYRNNVAHSLTRALACRFPVVERLVGGDFFAATARVYLQEDPPASPRLSQWGQGFAAFLERFEPAAALAYLPDVARLEWQRGQAYHAADAGPVSAEALMQAAADPGRHALRLHPSVAMVRSRFAVVSIWEANQPGQRPGGHLRANRAETALVLRDRADQVPVIALTEEEALCADALLRGATLLAATAGTEGSAAMRLLPLLMRVGAITGIAEQG
ncbi:HvfC/BufC N-terminal domain-containing protein [Paragemmobacter ruber]|uniref:DUF2063 domain-containing protein n=1 Tax=Paragemmobacter ruber TaxID=1985673 RepID=A0ABW9Y657_9RHOB|nr:DNA-binding domain-containing protein [Rhodobacter ruber]NBE07679.1 DUF2063 domain-containing protein [Rhodobacter ruber]